MNMSNCRCTYHIVFRLRNYTLQEGTRWSNAQNHVYYPSEQYLSLIPTVVLVGESRPRITEIVNHRIHSLYGMLSRIFMELMSNESLRLVSVTNATETSVRNAIIAMTKRNF